MFDITKRESFTNCERWLKELRDHAEPDTIIMLIGNKSDLASQRVVPTAEAKTFAGERRSLPLVYHPL